MTSLHLSHQKQPNVCLENSPNPGKRCNQYLPILQYKRELVVFFEWQCICFLNQLKMKKIIQLERFHNELELMIYQKLVVDKQEILLQNQ